MSLPKRLTVCADDFALDGGISEGILQLAERGRISAVSCLTDAPLWRNTGKRLLAYRDAVLIGLHFNLTEPLGFGSAPLPRIVATALARRLDLSGISEQLDRQIDRFVSVVGSLPDFIDGHQHVHALPVISGIVHKAAADLGTGTPIPVRDVRRFFGPTDAPFKRRAIGCLASLGYPRLSQGAGAQLNSRFAGDYSLSPAADYSKLFQGWIESAPDYGLIMCHPSNRSPDLRLSARVNEHHFLDAPAYTNLLDRHAIRFVCRDDLRSRSAEFQLPNPTD